MAASPSLYRKAARRRRTLTGFSQLWIGPGHLLLLKSTHFVEEYQRFAFSSIQSIVATEVPFNAAPRVVGLVAVLAAAIGAFGFNPFDSGSVPAIAVLLGAALVAALIVDVARGPRCRCVLQTAVSRQTLPVTRLRVARRFLDRVLPEIEAAQGKLSPERAAEIEAAGLIGSVVLPPPVPIAESRVPWVLFGMLLLNAGLSYLDVRFPRSQASTAFYAVAMAELALLIYFLMRPAHTAGRGTRSWTRAVAALALVCLVVDAIYLFSLGVEWVVAVAQSSRGAGLPPPLPINAVLPTPVIWFRPGWRAAAGVLGLLGAWWERGRSSPS